MKPLHLAFLMTIGWLFGIPFGFVIGHRAGLSSPLHPPSAMTEQGPAWQLIAAEVSVAMTKDQSSIPLRLSMGQPFYVDHELMQARSGPMGYTSAMVFVERGAGGTKKEPHAAGAVVYFPYSFTTPR